MYIRRIESLNPYLQRPLRHLDYLTHLNHVLKIVETIRTQASIEQEKVKPSTSPQRDRSLDLEQELLYEVYPVYAIFVPPEVLQKTHYEKVSLNERLSRLNQTLSSLSERAELSIDGLINLMS